MKTNPNTRNSENWEIPPPQVIQKLDDLRWGILELLVIGKGAYIYLTDTQVAHS
ncbi:hypothetical protein [Halobacillus naozhouensis]|uniref:Uncharacterized protein n=1 Tax=Halobacillus naozhouensis TaxID=554880 RepID=A0ABY8IYX5_9BACI|nr:hypothetical protein [Halobacillus naozhouensis]WFT75433.1 hypothetical protein P9989_03270 [Halobacillus naozhouensis]